jgi:hypothetical protein
VSGSIARRDVDSRSFDELFPIGTLVPQIHNTEQANILSTIKLQVKVKVFRYKPRVALGVPGG